MGEMKLSKGVWTYDESKPLGSPGGFGTVFEGKGVDGEHVAVKRLNLTAPQVAYRELHVADELLERELVQVLPFLDAGQDANSDQYFTVMPIAERDLQNEIDARGAIPQSESANILLSIVDGLLEVHDLVHRDLKPRNVLLHDGKWKIADFGLARFLEESTSLNTVMEGMTAPYAAPEQWNLEPASHATDVYALGCIAYALLTGKSPFQGPTRADYRSQHLNVAPPALENVSPLLRSLVAMMLRKQPQSRPELPRVREQLQKVVIEEGEKSASTTGMAALARAGAAHAERTAAEEAAARQKTTILNTRRQVSDEGFRILTEIFNEMTQRIRDTAPTAHVQLDRSFGGRVTLGMAELSWGTWHESRLIPKDAFPASKWDVYAGAFIRIVQKSSNYSVGFGSCLWYLKWTEDSACRWHEVSYMTSPLSRDRRPYEPFDLQEIKEADLATSNVMHVYQRAFGPKPIDDEDKEEFLERWLVRFAEASEGHLQRPGQLPLD